MAKVLRCKDVGMDCDFEARAESEEEVLKQAAEHAAATHDMKRYRRMFSPRYVRLSVTSNDDRKNQRLIPIRR